MDLNAKLCCLFAFVLIINNNQKPVQLSSGVDFDYEMSMKLIRLKSLLIQNREIITLYLIAIKKRTEPN